MTDPRKAVAAFFDRVVGVFATFDAEKVADLFAWPGVALRSDGTLVPLTRREDVVIGEEPCRS